MRSRRWVGYAFGFVAAFVLWLLVGAATANADDVPSPSPGSPTTAVTAATQTVDEGARPILAPAAPLAHTEPRTAPVRHALPSAERISSSAQTLAERSTASTLERVTTTADHVLRGARDAVAPVRSVVSAATHSRSATSSSPGHVSTHPSMEQPAPVSASRSARTTARPVSHRGGPRVVLGGPMRHTPAGDVVTEPADGHAVTDPTPRALPATDPHGPRLGGPDDSAEAAPGPTAGAGGTAAGPLSATGRVPTSSALGAAGRATRSPHGTDDPRPGCTPD